MPAVLPWRHTSGLWYQQFLADRRLRGFSPATLEWYRYCLGPFLRFVGEDLQVVSEQVVRRFLSQQAQHAGACRLNHYRQAVHQFYEWLLAEGYATHNPAAGIPKVREPKALVQSFTRAEVVALLAQPNRRTFVGLRDYVFMLTLLDTGLRISEATGLTLESLDLDLQTIRVLGKGNKERLVGFSEALLRELLPYLARRQAALQHIGQGACSWLFPSHTAGRCRRRSLGAQIERYGQRAGLTRVRVSPHTFRHTFALWFVRQGGSPFHLQKILGHRSLEMSRRYCELADLDAITKQQELSPLVTMDLGLRGRRRLR